MFATGLKRILPHAIKQAKPITPEILLKISKVVHYADNVELMAWVETLLGFYMFLRKSNLVPDTMDDFDGTKQFQRQHIKITGPENVMMVEIHWSKTIQFKQKVLRVPVLPAKNKNICPVLWMYILINKVHAKPTEPVFLIRQGLERKCLSANHLLYELGSG